MRLSGQFDLEFLLRVPEPHRTNLIQLILLLFPYQTEIIKGAIEKKRAEISPYKG
jgi:hypothetical protein